MEKRDNEPGSHPFSQMQKRPIVVLWGSFDEWEIVCQLREKYIWESIREHKMIISED